MKSGKGAVDFELLRYHCSVPGVMVPGGAAKGFQVLPAVLDSGLGMSMI